MTESEDYSEVVAQLHDQRRQQREFFAVVILVGLALNLCASLLWTSLEALSFPLRLFIVSLILATCCCVALIGIYFRPERTKRHRYYCIYYFIPLSQDAGYDVIKRNTLGSGPLLWRLGKHCSWTRLLGDGGKDRSLSPIIDALTPFFVMEPLLAAFDIRWSRGEEFASEFIDFRDANGRVVHSVRQEAAGGTFVDFQQLWSILTQHCGDAFFAGENITSEILDPCLHLKLPPGTTINVASGPNGRHLSLTNQYVRVSLSGSHIAIAGDLDANILTEAHMAFECSIEFRLLSRFRRHFDDYFIWTRRIVGSLDRYFNAPVRDRSPEWSLPEPILLVVGDKRDSAYYYHTGKDSDRVASIPKDRRAYFNSESVAKAAGFARAKEQSERSTPGETPPGPQQSANKTAGGDA